MKKIPITLAAVMIMMMTSCEKDEINPSNSNLKDKLKECRKCGGTWDITDPDEEP